MTAPFSVLVIDEHPIVRSGLVQLIKSSANFVLCGEAGSAFEARTAVIKWRPKLTILGLTLDGREGTELITELRGLHPSGRILVFTEQPEKLFARRALKAGAQGYLVKSAGLPQVRLALAALARGERFVSAALGRDLLEESLTGKKALLDDLSDRELQVLRLVAADRELGEIAVELNLSVKTVGTYRERLKNKLGVDTARQLARQAASMVGPSDVAEIAHGAGRASRAHQYYC